MVTLDVPHVFRVCGGPRGLLDLLDAHQPDHGLRYPTVQMWAQRESIPAKFQAMILYSLDCQGHSCREFFIDKSELILAPAVTRARTGD